MNKKRAWDPLKETWLSPDEFALTGSGEVLLWNESSNSWDYTMLDIKVTDSTGLKDKNGKEIYEGDIVIKPYIDPMGGLHRETEDGRFQVGFENGQFVIYRTEADPLIDWCEKEKGEYVSNYGNKTVIKNKTVFEIIGNIYENPELLTQLS